MATTVTANDTAAFVPAAKAPATKKPATRGFFGRWLEALMAARMKEAERQVRRYRALIDADAGKAFDRLPFTD